MPFMAQRRHQYWSVDIRYLDVAHVDGKVYCISILENFSRAILASGIFPQQDLGARVPSGWHDDLVRGDPAAWHPRGAGQR